MTRVWVFVLLLAASGVACNDSTDTADHLLASAPIETLGFSYADLRGMREDGTDAELVSDREEGLDPLVEVLPIDGRDVDAYTTYRLGEAVYFLVSAHVDQSTLRDELAGAGFESTEISNTPAWAHGDDALVFRGHDEYLFGPSAGIGDFLEASRGERPSLEDREDMVEVFRNLLDSSRVLAVDLFGFCDASMKDCTANALGVGAGDYNQVVWAFDSEDSARSFSEEALPFPPGADVSIDGKIMTVILEQSGE